MAVGALTALEEMTPLIIKNLNEALDSAKQNMEDVKATMMKNAESQNEDIQKLKMVLKEDHAKYKEKILEVEQQTERQIRDLWRDGERRIEAVCNGLEVFLGENKLKEQREIVTKSANSILNNVLDNLHKMAAACSKELDDIYEGSLNKVESHSHSD